MTTPRILLAGALILFINMLAPAMAASNEQVATGMSPQAIQQQLQSATKGSNASEKAEASQPAEMPTSREDFEKMMYQVCHKQMVAGMKEGINEGKDKKDNKALLNDPQVTDNMEKMAKSVCECAVPKFTDSVLASMKEGKNPTQEAYEKEAMSTILDCMQKNAGAIDKLKQPATAPAPAEGSGTGENGAQD